MFFLPLLFLAVFFSSFSPSSSPLSHRRLLLFSPPTKNQYSESSPPDLDALALDLPDDHPFAVRAEVSPEEQELAAARLRVRRGLPLRDLSGARGFSSSPLDEELR